MAEKKKLGVGGIISILIGAGLIYQFLTKPGLLSDLIDNNTLAWYWKVPFGVFMLIGGLVMAKLLAGDAESFDGLVIGILAALMGAILIGGTVFVPVSNFYHSLSKTWQVVLKVFGSLLGSAVGLLLLIRFDKSLQKKD